MPRTLRCGWLGWMLAVAMLSGCTYSSRVVVTKLDDDVPAEKAIGLPYNLTRPVFEVTETLATAANPQTTYGLSLRYEPDPYQRYTVDIEPANFSEADINLTLGELGQLSSLNATVRDQAVPTITAVGDFLIKAAGVVAT